MLYNTKHFESPAAITVGTDFTTLVTMDPPLRGYGETIAFEVENAGTTAFSGFQVQLMDHVSGEWYTFLSGTDFDATGNANLRFALGAVDTSPKPQKLAGGARAHVHIRVNGAYNIRFQAKVASGVTTAKIRGTYRPI